MSTATISLAIHGGATEVVDANYSRELAHMRDLIEAGRDRLRSGASALQIVVEVVSELEASGLYTAGRGSSPNAEGEFELDASVMDGLTRMAGAVAGLQGFVSPAKVALAVMERSPHVMLVGKGAASFARTHKMEEVGDPGKWYVPASRLGTSETPDALAYGTVGCVARDRDGRLAAATSTGGVLGKLPGRCGDTAVIGAGNWADDCIAISCTGQGEYFIRTGLALNVAHRVRMLGQGIVEAAQAALAEVSSYGGAGGLIAVDARGTITMPFASPAMKRAALLPDGSVVTSVL